MADERELAALKAQVAAIERAHAQDSAGKAVREYIVHSQVFSDCHEPIEGPEPPTGPGSRASVHERLNRIEEQLQRVIALLEK
jgi:hypothetical protein